MEVFFIYVILDLYLDKTGGWEHAALIALGYSKEMLHSGVVYYLLHRPLNIIPIAWTAFTVFTVFTILVRGKCFTSYKSYIGLSLENFLLLNLVVLVGGLAPLLVEALVLLFVAVFVLYLVGLFLRKLRYFLRKLLYFLGKLADRFNDSCAVKPKKA